MQKRFPVFGFEGNAEDGSLLQLSIFKFAHYSHYTLFGWVGGGLGIDHDLTSGLDFMALNGGRMNLSPMRFPAFVVVPEPGGWIGTGIISAGGQEEQCGWVKSLVSHGRSSVDPGSMVHGSRSRERCGSDRTC